MRIYLDTCCFNRPFDDRSVDRIALEAEAVLRILSGIEEDEWQLVVGDVLILELRRMNDAVRRKGCLAMTRAAFLHVLSHADREWETERLVRAGFKRMDAAHLAFASAGEADAFITVDDRLLRRANALVDTKLPPVMNPTGFLAVFGKE